MSDTATDPRSLLRTCLHARFEIADPEAERRLLDALGGMTVADLVAEYVYRLLEVPDDDVPGLEMAFRRDGGPPIIKAVAPTQHPA